MKKTLLFVLTLSVLSARTTSVIREYHYVEILKTWSDAQSYCREKFTDLATVENQSDNDRLLSVLQTLGNYAWIGLYDNMEGWKWALGNADFSNEYSNWTTGEPNNNNYNQTCTLMGSDGDWIDEPCSSQYPYRAVCYHENGPSKYIVVNTKMNWTDARTYCRSNYTDLASVSNQSENNHISSLLTENTWIGLHRNTWAYWSDQTPTTFTYWNENRPNKQWNTVKSCVEVRLTTGMWFDNVCSRNNYFICQKVYSRQQQTFKLKFQSEADLTDPALQQQMLEQLHAKLEKQGLSDFKLRWTVTDGQAFHKEQKKKKDEGSCG
ncbi:hypothetical protein VZT92_013892 [Zoarces viviparus]|uniref:C-type lectin domain-containing protein n=1 Tax=Zoarces viviparus TaxID=48416 RepID=A0AAW1F5I4_ZOAVI